jgi:hypothetical protein
MSCCGQKRADLLRQHVQREKPRASIEPDKRPEPDRPPRLLEYTGTGSIVLRGVVSGRLYCFGGHGDCIEVAYEDTFALLGEREIRPKGSAASNLRS